MTEHVNFTPLPIVSILAVAIPAVLHRIKVIRIPILVGPAALGFKRRGAERSRRPSPP